MSRTRVAGASRRTSGADGDRIVAHRTADLRSLGRSAAPRGAGGRRCRGRHRGYDDRHSGDPGRGPTDRWSDVLTDTTTTDLSTGDSRARALIAARAADDKQGTATIGLDVADVLAIVDWFVITSAGNPRQVRTIAEEVEAQVKARTGEGPLRVEGMDDARWVLLDFGDVVVHVFLEEVRAFYELERLWGDVDRLDWEPERPARLAADGAAP